MTCRKFTFVNSFAARWIKCRRQLLWVLLVFLPLRVFAHDAPLSISLNIFVKPANDALHILLRVPTAALGEVDFPKRGPGYFDFDSLSGTLTDSAMINSPLNNSSSSESALVDAIHIYLLENFTVYGEGTVLDDVEIQAARIELPSDRSFANYDTALANIQRPSLTNDTELMWNQGVLDVWLTYKTSQASSDFYFTSQLHRLAETTTTLIHYLPPDGQERVYSFTGNPGRVALNPGWWYAAFKFTALGFEHILAGFDHLLFLLCLIIPLRRIKQLIPIITAFTLAHSVTLIGSALGVTLTVGWFVPLIEFFIAASIVYMAVENILGLSLQRRWLVTFLFGLIHGFGFSFILSDSLQFAGSHLITSLLAFNIGVELGQLLVVVLVVPVLWWLFRRVPVERVGVVLLSALVLHEAWHWMTERLGTLTQYEWLWPSVDALFYLGLMRWLMLGIVATAVLWLVGWFFKRLQWLQAPNH